MSAIYHAHQDGLSLSTSTTATFLEVIAGASEGIEIVEWSVSFGSTAATDHPILCEMMVGQSAASTSPTTFTPFTLTPKSQTFTGTCQHSPTAEPTWLLTLDSVYVHPNGGAARIQPIHPLRVAPNTAVGIRLTTGTITAGVAQTALSFASTA